MFRGLERFVEGVCEGLIECYTDRIEKDCFQRVYKGFFNRIVKGLQGVIAVIDSFLEVEGL